MAAAAPGGASDLADGSAVLGEGVAQRRLMEAPPVRTEVIIVRVVQHLARQLLKSAETTGGTWLGPGLQPVSGQGRKEGSGAPVPPPVPAAGMAQKHGNLSVPKHSSSDREQTAHGRLVLQGGLDRAGTSSAVLVFPFTSSYGMSHWGAVTDPVLIKNVDS